MTTLQKLKEKYLFNEKQLSKRCGLACNTVHVFFNGGNTRIGNVKKIINVLPITPEERTALIESLFSPSEG